ncbi:hypothetical protein DFJ73DRAFT_619829 [Zopfochytrium polystomum]|nr:hypothetical protein DFJ73DRAFT_619829 [Zopfochytrium polystomum]
MTPGATPGTSLPVRPEFPFSRLQKLYPNLTTAQLINANNYDIKDLLSGKVDPRATPAIPTDADVVVAGAGMASLIYAIELKKTRPSTSVVVLEKAHQPSYKIGESTLSPFSRFCNSNILPVAYMLRLFALKEGLDFALVDRDGGDVQYQDIGGLDYSFQLEREVSELLFTMKAQQLGVKVFFGCGVASDKSDISSTSGVKTVGISVAPGLVQKPAAKTSIRAKVVGDGTGLVRALVSKESKAVPFKGMNFNSYWAYFKEDIFKSEDAVKDWLYPATNHLCYEEGWSWWIRLLSWKATPICNMMDYITYLIAMQSANVDHKNLPTIQTLAKTFNCTYTSIVSIGFVVRSEAQDNFPAAPYVDQEKGKDGEKRFWAIVHKYPHIEKILHDSGRYTLLQNYYGPARGTYFTRRNMSYRQDTVAGDGWYGLGIAAGFTSPLFSPGINCICLPSGFLAARLTATQLDAGATAEAARTARDEFAGFMDRHIEGLREVDVLLYNMFRHPRFFNAIFPLFFVNGMANVSKNYSPNFRPAEIHWGNGVGEKTWAVWTPQVFPLIEQAVITDEICEQVEAICLKYKKEYSKVYTEWTKYSRYMRYYDDDMEYHPEKGKRVEPDFPAVRCTQCRHANGIERSPTCVMCDTVLPPYVSTVA